MSTDPIAKLLWALETEGKPSLAWVIEHSQAGIDPVHDAWGKSQDADAMFRFACRVQARPSLRSYEFTPRVWSQGHYELEIKTGGLRLLMIDGRLWDLAYDLSREFVYSGRDAAGIYYELNLAMSKLSRVGAAALAMRRIFHLPPTLAEVMERETRRRGD